MKKSRKNTFILIILLTFAILFAIYNERSHEKQRIVESDFHKAIEYSNQTETTTQAEKTLVLSKGRTIKERFILPEGFERVSIENNSFKQWLREFPLKETGAKVHFFDGRVKEASVHEAVLDLDLGNRDLQQCADSIIRLRAEYFYKTKEFNKIHFNFTNGFNADYGKWRKGYGISISGNKTSWVLKKYANKSEESFHRYLNMVFSYSGTLSLVKELEKVNYEDLEIGDVFIRGGSPGHCLIVMDVAINKTTGKKIFIVAQGFMPAQEMHVIKNLGDSENSPWYGLVDSEKFDFAGMEFQRNQLKRFE